MRILNWKNKDGHTCLCFGKFNTLDLLFFCSVPYVTVSVRIIARLACNLGKTRWTRLITKTAKMIKMAWVFSGFNQHWHRKIVFKYWKYILNTLKSVSKYIWFGKGHAMCNISRRTNLHTLFKCRFRFLCYCRPDQLSNVETVLEFWYI